VLNAKLAAGKKRGDDVTKYEAFDSKGNEISVESLMAMVNERMVFLCDPTKRPRMLLCLE
jgi:hypothetical protein